MTQRIWENLPCVTRLFLSMGLGMRLLRNSCPISYDFNFAVVQSYSSISLVTNRMTAHVTSMSLLRMKTLP